MIGEGVERMGVVDPEMQEPHAEKGWGCPAVDKEIKKSVRLLRKQPGGVLYRWLREAN